MTRRRRDNALELLVAAFVLYRLAVKQEVRRRVQGALTRVREAL